MHIPPPPPLRKDMRQRRQAARVLRRLRTLLHHLRRGIQVNQALVDAEAESAVGAMVVSVCGVGALADDVRRATRRWQTRGNVDLAEESFSW